jgi:hypothetical protein
VLSVETCAAYGPGVCAGPRPDKFAKKLRGPVSRLFRSYGWRMRFRSSVCATMASVLTLIIRGFKMAMPDCTNFELGTRMLRSDPIEASSGQQSLLIIFLNC